MAMDANTICKRSTPPRPPETKSVCYGTHVRHKLRVRSGPQTSATLRMMVPVSPRYNPKSGFVKINSPATRKPPPTRTAAQ